MTRLRNDIDVAAVLALFREVGVTGVWRLNNTDSTEVETSPTRTNRAGWSIQRAGLDHEARFSRRSRQGAGELSATRRPR